MPLYFAYGSNMDRAHMARLCRGAEALGPARLDHHRFFIARAGYASIAPKRGAVVHGVLWKIAAAQLPRLDQYEAVTAGLYRRAEMPVHHGERLLRALVYVANDPRPGRSSPAYRAAIGAAARDWQLPADYLRELAAVLDPAEAR
jgi:gamma-glutamylcyclotransferase (GGCT)/AIG2-like uncharacterized protein YtfP